MEIRTPTPRVILSVTGERVYIFVGSSNVICPLFQFLSLKIIQTQFATK